ncbi:Mechanosensitive ion channel family protein OS=Streptomyces alboniger OX=132473 GN=CP975_09030 PE=4 SV=1 [Streptomyces alboniger]
MTDTTPTTMQVRALVTAKDADDIWTVRVTVREQLIQWLTAHHPYALPRVTTAWAEPSPGAEPSSNGHRPRPLSKEAPRTGRG